MSVTCRIEPLPARPTASGWSAGQNASVRVRLIAPLAAGLLLAGCATVAPSTYSPPASVTSTPTPTPTYLSEKPVTLRVGQTVDLSGTRGLVKATVTVDSIQENAPCASGEETPANGQFVAVRVTGKQGQDKTFDLATYRWVVVDVDGQEIDPRAEVVSGRCLPEAERLTPVYTGGQVTGTVLLDAPTLLSRILVRNSLASPPVTVTIELPPR